mmetsp:Transcript_51159/g.92108  ORF Transcript_51159/g.92108 Transcript_51159/m.92108 type:complete len:259 (-) Transcript_51159:47-823(-)
MFRIIRRWRAYIRRSRHRCTEIRRAGLRDLQSLVGSAQSSSKSAQRPGSSADRDALHHDGRGGIVVLGWNLGDCNADVHALDDLAEHRVLGRSRREPVEVLVVGHVEEELRASRVWLAGVGHGQSARSIRVPGDVLVLDVSTVAAPLRGASDQVLKLSVGRPALACIPRVWVPRVGAAELIHEARDDAMEMDTIVEAGAAKIDKIGRGDWHPVKVDLCLEASHGSLESGSWVRHLSDLLREELEGRAGRCWCRCAPRH